MIRRARVFAPATIGNVGPGFDVLGLAVEGLGDTVEVRLDLAKDECVVTGRDAELVPKAFLENAAAIAARAYLTKKGHKKRIFVSVCKGLPLAGGLGGSAASSIGGALAAAYALGGAFEAQDILRAAAEGEAHAAGWHFDNLAPCYFGGLTLVLPAIGRVLPHIVRLRVASGLWIALVSPFVRLETKRARAVLPKSSPREQWVRQMARTSALTIALQRGDHALIGASLQDEIVEKARAPLIPRFAQAKRAALRSGALACSISGAGPTTFALCPDEDTAWKCARAMEKAFGGGALHVGRVAKRGAYRLKR